MKRGFEAPRVRPSIEALCDPSDDRLLAELEVSAVLEKLARVRAMVDRADRLLKTVVADSTTTDPDEAEVASRVTSQLLMMIRKKRTM
jgi:hypothetical protein